VDAGLFLLLILVYLDNMCSRRLNKQQRYNNPNSCSAALPDHPSATQNFTVQLPAQVLTPRPHAGPNAGPPPPLTNGARDTQFRCTPASDTMLHSPGSVQMRKVSTISLRICVWNIVFPCSLLVLGANDRHSPVGPVLRCVS
jgi:hypothetical protein